MYIPPTLVSRSPRLLSHCSILLWKIGDIVVTGLVNALTWYGVLERAVRSTPVRYLDPDLAQCAGAISLDKARSG